MAIWITEQDEEDFEQELQIKKWLETQQQGAVEFDFKSINRKGNARYLGVRASLSLDQKVSEDSTGTFADLIAGSDGRDLYCGEVPDAETYLDAYLSCLGFDEEMTEWLIKKLKSSMDLNSLRFEKSLTDLEW